MKNGEVKHSKDLVEADLEGEKSIAALWEKMGMTIRVKTLSEYQAKEGFYIGFNGGKANFSVSLKGPFADAEMAKEAHREWMWEAKHS